MPALSRLARRLQEEHRLQRQDIGADQHLQHVEDARVEQVALVQRELPVEHVDPQEILRLLARREVRGRRFQPLHCHAAIHRDIPLGHLGHLLREPPLHQVLGVRLQLGDFFRRDQPPHDQEPLLAERAVLLHRHLIAIGSFGRRRSIGGCGHPQLLSVQVALPAMRAIVPGYS